MNKTQGIIFEFEIFSRTLYHKETIKVQVNEKNGA